jgi:hypothetical protein
MPALLTQYLCVNQHCILAVSWEALDFEQAQVEGLIMERIKELKILPWCGLCGSTNLHFKTAPLPFDSVAQAMPALKACEAAQALTREFAPRPKDN